MIRLGDYILYGKHLKLRQVLSLNTLHGYGVSNGVCVPLKDIYAVVPTLYQPQTLTNVNILVNGYLPIYRHILLCLPPSTTGDLVKVYIPHAGVLEGVVSHWEGSSVFIFELVSHAKIVLVA